MEGNCRNYKGILGDGRRWKDMKSKDIEGYAMALKEMERDLRRWMKLEGSGRRLKKIDKG